MTAEILPVDVQVRADAELGRAWRRCEAALPDGWELRIEGRTGFLTSHALNLRDATDFVTADGNTPTDALDSLADELESR